MPVVIFYFVSFVKFYLLEVPRAFILFFLQLDWYIMQLFSLPLLVQTFFKPLKNEYRKDLVRFSILFGIGLKIILILADLVILLIVVLCEIFIFFAFFGIPLYLAIKAL